MSGPADGSVDVSAEEPPAPSARERTPRRMPPRRQAGRAAAIGTVIAVIVVMTVVAAVFAPGSAAPTPDTFDAVPVPPAGAYSTSAFCASGAGTVAADTIFLANASAAAVTGVMTTVGVATAGATAPTTRRSISVPARGTAAVDPAQGLPAGSTASTFVFDGGGVVASQVVAGSTGWSMAPCATRTSPQWSFAGGSTTAGNSVGLALFNPTSTEAVVDVTFVTNNGRETPQAYQGVVVPPGQQVVENLGAFVQNASSLATLVTAQAGMVVSDELQQWASGSATGLSLQLGAPRLSTVWRFAQTTDTAGATVGFTLANPTDSPVTASMAVDLSSGSVVPRHVSVPPLSTTVFATSTAVGLPKGVPYAVVVTAPIPIVVGRSVEAPAGAATPAWGASSGTVSLADRWLVPGPGVPGAPGTASATIENVAVANPGATMARVTVSTLGGSRPPATFLVRPGSLAVVAPKLVAGLDVLEVTSSVPVDVEQDSGPTGAPGIVSSAGFPFP